MNMEQPIIEGGEPSLTSDRQSLIEQSVNTNAGPAERARVETPRIYAATLSDYNAGRLHGAWIDADQDPEELQAEIDAMLAKSAEPVAEEWAIHDYEGFGLFKVD